MRARVSLAESPLQCAMRRCALLPCRCSRASRVPGSEMTATRRRTRSGLTCERRQLGLGRPASWSSIFASSVCGCQGPWQAADGEGKRGGRGQSERPARLQRPVSRASATPISGREPVAAARARSPSRARIESDEPGSCLRARLHAACCGHLTNTVAPTSWTSHLA